MLFLIGTSILIIMGIFCWIGIKKSYDKGNQLPTNVSIAIWIADTIHILLEEPYLERIFGEEFRSYKSKTPRYLGIPKR